MGAVKEMMMDAGQQGFVVTEAADVARWAAATGSPVQTKAITVEVRGRKVECLGLPAAEARRLWKDERLADEDRDAIYWGMAVGGIDPTPGCCPTCGGDNVTFLVDANFWDGRLTVVNADEPEGPNYRHGAFCEDCEMAVDATPPEWTYAMRDDALAAYAAPKLRDALIALHRAATEANVTAPAVDAAAATLRGIGYEFGRGKMYYQ